MSRNLPPHGYEGQRATPRPISTAPRVLIVDDLPPAADLARRGLSFEQVNPYHAEPVRLRLNGEGLGIFAARRLAAQLIKTLPVICLALLLMSAPAARAACAELRAIAMVEDWQGRRGAAGERGPWQMMPGTWAQYTGTAEERAAQHLSWLRRQLVRQGVEPSAFNLALCWNAGLRATVTGRAPVSSYDYARRVVAILEAGR